MASDDDVLVSSKEIAEYLRVGKKTLERYLALYRQPGSSNPPPVTKIRHKNHYSMLWTTKGFISRWWFQVMEEQNRVYAERRRLKRVEKKRALAEIAEARVQGVKDGED